MYARLILIIRVLVSRTQVRLHDRSPTLLMFGTIFLFGVFYRCATYLRLFSTEFTPHSFVPGFVTLYGLPREYLADLVFGAAFIPIVWLPQRLLQSVSTAQSAKVVGWTMLYLLLGFVGFISGAHHDLVFEAHSALTWTVVLESFSTGSVRDIFSYGTLPGQLCMVTPSLLFTAFLWMPRRLETGLARVLVATALLVLAGQLPSLCRTALGKNNAKRPAWPLRAPPALFVLDNIAENLLRKEGKFERRARLLAPANSYGLRLKSWDHTPDDPAPLQKIAQTQSSTRKWNILLVLMESTGAEYAFKPNAQGKVPMPFLEMLSHESVYLKNHRSTANTSPRAIFSIMSGVYGNAQPQMFCTGPDVVIPSLGSYLGHDYEKFLVTPGRLQSYVPAPFFKHSGVTELVDDLLLPDSNREADGGARHEMDAVDFMDARLESAKEPFFATYYSYAPHTPYSDHGPEYRISKGNTKRELYINNLRLLDVAIERIFRKLETTGRLARTVIIFVADHGEGFGQHKGSWVHGRTSFEEIYRVPAMLYQPALFAPATISTPTSHVDILPTLLDALDLEVPRETLQGDSLFSSSSSEYRYSYGNEDALSSVSKAGTKVIVSFEKDYCVAYNLKRDPEEKESLSCNKFAAQRDELLRFRQFQNKALPQYNAELLHQ